MSLPSARQEILDLLKTIPYVDIYSGFTDDAAFTELLKTSDSITPMIVVSFGGMIQPAKNVNGIIGAAHDSHLITLTVKCIASTEDDAITVWQLAWDKLIGYTPVNCGEIQAALYGGTGEVSILGVPVRHAAVQVFSFMVNSDN